MLYWKGFCIINEFWCFQCKCLVFRFGSIPDDAFNHKFTPWQGSIKAPIWRKRSHFRGNQMAGCLNTYPTHLHEIAWHFRLLPLFPCCVGPMSDPGFAMRGSTPRVRVPDRGHEFVFEFSVPVDDDRPRVTGNDAGGTWSNLAWRKHW